MTETEVKVRIDDLAALRTKLLTLGVVVMKERHFEENTLYDFRDRRLQERREALRVRKVGRKTFLTFKGTPQKSRKYKIRTEYETEVRSARDLVRILQSLGLAEAARYEKHRTVLRKGTLLICLDETRAGTFVEFEGEREKIAQIARALGLPKKNWIQKSYLTLLREAGEGV
ncbi:MAG: class IV adenylate cyclase [Candidatus Aminicenantes bacterium]|nr:class IV adenylate cyclase [Candidatus Aminicenantes bacterium]